MKKEDIDILLNKYYQGLSSDDEEKILHDFFSGADVPDGYAAESAMFGYMDSSSIPGPSPGFEERIISSLDRLDHVPSKKRIISRKLVLAFSGIAAGIIVIFGSWIFSRSTGENTFSDPEIAYAETLKILYEVSEKLNMGTAHLEPVSKMNIKGLDGLQVLSESKKIVDKNLENLRNLHKFDDNLPSGKEN